MQGCRFSTFVMVLGEISIPSQSQVYGCNLVHEILRQTNNDCRKNLLGESVTRPTLKVENSIHLLARVGVNSE